MGAKMSLPDTRPNFASKNTLVANLRPGTSGTRKLRLAAWPQVPLGAVRYTARVGFISIAGNEQADDEHAGYGEPWTGEVHDEAGALAMRVVLPPRRSHLRISCVFDAEGKLAAALVSCNRLVGGICENTLPKFIVLGTTPRIDGQPKADLRELCPSACTHEGGRWAHEGTDLYLWATVWRNSLNSSTKVQLNLDTPVPAEVKHFNVFQNVGLAPHTGIISYNGSQKKEGVCKVGRSTGEAKTRNEFEVAPGFDPGLAVCIWVAMQLGVDETWQ